MASILFSPINNSKGIILFKNNELHLLDKDVLEKLSKKYYIGLYFGNFQNKLLEIPSLIDFTLAAKGIVDNIYNKPHINLQGWNFSASSTSPFVTQKPRFTLQSFAFNGMFKRTRHILSFFKHYLLLNKDLTARIFVVNQPDNRFHDHSLSKYYCDQVDSILRKRLVLHKLDTYSPAYLSNEESRIILSASKINVVASMWEGANRVIAESLLMKRPVLLSKATKMADVSSIDSKAFRIFDSLDSFVSLTNEMSPIAGQYNPEEIYPEFYIENSIKFLASSIEKIFPLKASEIIDYYYKNSCDKLFSHYLTAHTKIINFSSKIDDDVCTDLNDIRLLVKSLTQEEINISTANKPIIDRIVNYYRAFRNYAYYLKFKIRYKISSTRTTKKSELNLKHFGK